MYLYFLFLNVLFFLQALAKEQTYDNLDMTVVEALNKAEVCYMLFFSSVLYYFLIKFTDAIFTYFNYIDSSLVRIF